MMSEPIEKKNEKNPSFYVGKKLLFMSFITTLLLVFAYYGLAALVKGYEGIASSITVLVGIPFFVGAWGVFIFNTKEKRPPSFYYWFPSFLVMTVLLIGAFFLREGVVCLVMLSPIWWVSALWGSFTVKRLQKKLRERSKLSCSVLILLPFLTLFFDALFPLSTEHKLVSRDIIIDAPITAIWPRLHTVENIDISEGRWNISQNILGIPRPKSATFQGRGVGAVRLSQWGKAISFEEHITYESAPTALEWDFVFPNDSLQNNTDEHISPDGEILKIQKGGYHLTSLNKDQTRLTLYTEYEMTVPLKTYSALWGELFLGDIQNNILQVIKSRSETTPR